MFTVLLASTLLHLPAQENPNKVRDDITLESVVITASKQKEKSTSAPRSIVTVDASEKTKQQARSIPEALDEATGVMVQNTNRGSGAPIIRGLIGPQNLIVVDGIRFNTSTFRTGPNQYLAMLDPHGINRIEVVRGPSSVLYGNGAMGGVIHVLTLDPHPAKVFSGTASGRFASADLSGGGTANLSSQHGDLGILVGGSFDHFGTLKAGGGEEQPISNYQTSYWRTKLIYDPGSLSITAAYFGAAILDAGRADKLGKGELRRYNNIDHLAYLRASWSGDGAVKKVEATVTYHGLDEDVDRYNCNTDDTSKTVINKTQCVALETDALKKKRNNTDAVHVIGGELNASLSWFNNGLNLTHGAEFYHDTVDSTRTDTAKESDGTFGTPTVQERGNFSNGSTYQTLGAFTHLRAALYRSTSQDQELRLSGGLRYSHFSAEANDVPNYGNVSYDFGGLVASGGLQWLMADKLNVYASFAQGFRAPNLQETTVQGNTGKDYDVPNPDLRPERSDSLEVGVKTNVGPVSLQVAYFYSLLTDFIDTKSLAVTDDLKADNPDLKTVRQRINTDGMSQGIESSLGVKWRRLSLNAGVAFMQSEVERPDGTTVPARRIPPLFGTGSLQYTHPDKRFYAQIFTRFAAAQDELHPGDKSDLRICETTLHSGVIDDDCKGSSAWVTLGLRGGYKYGDNIQMDLTLNNLLDTYYKVHGSGVPGAGFDARFSLTATF